MKKSQTTKKVIAIQILIKSTSNRRYPLRVRKPSEKFVPALSKQIIDSDTPTIKEALASADKSKWETAIHEELKALKSSNAYELVLV